MARFCVDTYGGNCGHREVERLRKQVLTHWALVFAAVLIMP